jgi:hypothetical protein
MASLIPDSATLVAADGVLATEFGDEVVLLNLDDGVYYGLDDAGALVWRLLRRPTSVADLRDAIVAEYDVDPGRCERDVRTLLAELADRGLIAVRPVP